jgi:hypothetical protein
MNKRYIRPASQGFGTGTGNVTGPGTSAVGNIALFNATNGQILSDAGFALPLDKSHIRDAGLGEQRPGIVSL